MTNPLPHTTFRVLDHAGELLGQTTLSLGESVRLPSGRRGKVLWVEFRCSFSRVWTLAAVGIDGSNEVEVASVELLKREV